LSVAILPQSKYFARRVPRAYDNFPKAASEPLVYSSMIYFVSGHPMFRKILIVEDNADTRELLHCYFTDADFSVVMAVNGEDGFDVATAERPDIVLTDLSMPRVSRIDMIKTLRAHTKTALIPILAITAYSGLTEAAIQSGATQVNSKPPDFFTLSDLVRNLLKQTNSDD
jgi:CheY-like chemotaxis protein